VAASVCTDPWQQGSYAGSPALAEKQAKLQQGRWVTLNYQKLHIWDETFVFFYLELGKTSWTDLHEVFLLLSCTSQRRGFQRIKRKNLLFGYGIGRWSQNSLRFFRMEGFHGLLRGNDLSLSCAKNAFEKSS